MKKIAAICLLATALIAMPAFTEDTPETDAPEPLWTGDAALSYVSTSGNTDTSSFGLDFSFVRRPTPWGFEAYGLFNQADTDGIKTAERYLAGIRGTRELNDRWSVFGGLSGEKDAFAGFDLRTMLEAGATYKAVDNGKIFLSFDGGLTYTDEDRIEPEPDTSFMGGLAAMHFGWTISENAKLTEDLVYFPNFDTSSDWRLESVTALEASLTDLFGLRLSYEWRFRNEPIGDNDDTDTTTKASLVLKF
jgi:putative salt-induced outer membrane protein